MNTPTIAWSNFALRRHKPGTGFSYFRYDQNALPTRIKRCWPNRRLAKGCSDINAVCEVPLDGIEDFVTSTINVKDATNITAELYRRQPHEDPYIKLYADGPTVPCKFASVILYSAAELLKNGGERSSDADYEIVCVIASDCGNEPMSPLAMARNQLAMPGGTPRMYTSEEWAEAVYYWSGKIQKRPTV